MKEEPPAPSVSIIVPAYNVEGYLRRCLDSVIAQTITDWECICVDNASPDACGAILDEYAAKDSRFAVIHIKENCGPGGARRAGQNMARGEYIGFVDADDWIEPDMYEQAIETARRADADIVQWGYVKETEAGSFPSKERLEGFYNPLKSVDSIFMWNKLFKRSFLLENGIATPSIYHSEDAVFTVLANTSAQKCYCINRALYHYDATRENSISHLDKNESDQERIDYSMKYAEELQKACEYVTAREKQRNRETEKQRNRETEKQRL